MMYLFPDGVQELDANGTLSFFGIGYTEKYSTDDLIRLMAGEMMRRGKYSRKTIEIYCAQVAAEFYRSLIDSHYPQWQMPSSYPPEAKKLIRAEAMAWEAAWDCLERMNSVGAWDFPIPTIHPVLGLSSLVSEGLILNFVQPPSDESNKDKFIRRKMTETQEMRGDGRFTTIGNPYRDHSGFTKQFVDSANKLCARSDRFKAKRWIPFLKARARLNQAVKGESLCLIDDDTGVPIDGRGRKKLIPHHRTLTG